jgi:CheY-like chemotaxis protein
MPRLDGLGLCAALREEPALDGVPVVLLGDDGPPQAVWGADVASRPLVEAVLAALASSLPTPAPRPEPPTSHSPESDADEGSEPVAEDEERENARAQSAVAMHREPANRVLEREAEVWRLRVSGAPKADGSVSGFGAETAVMSRILGLGFLALLVATVGLIVWRTLPTESSPTPDRVVRTGPTEASPTLPAKTAAVPTPVWGGFSGQLRPGMDAAAGALDGQGVLELEGPSGVTVVVDGRDVGRLPVALPLDQGRHRVRYRFGDTTTDRFYLVKSGSTRALTVITRPGGFVDAR